MSFLRSSAVRAVGVVEQGAAAVPPSRGLIGLLVSQIGHHAVEPKLTMTVTLMMLMVVSSLARP